MLTESHEKKEAWRQIWYLTQKDAQGNYLYRKGLRLEERGDLIRAFADFLDYERGMEMGERLGASNYFTDDRDKKDREDQANDAANGVDYLDIHDPKHYFFGEEKLWIPWALDAPSGAKRGRYKNKYPRGLVLHWTAGHRNGLKEGNELMRNTGMLYLLGDAKGDIAQSDSLQWHGYHAGKSSHKFASGYVSDEFVGLELQASGLLKKKGGKFMPWFDYPVPKEEVVYSKTRENIYGGYYHMYTREQMLAARKLVCWLYLNNPDVFSIDRVVGHDEVSPGRKVDPGASPTEDGKVLAMSEFRRLCWNDVDKIVEKRKSAA